MEPSTGPSLKRKAEDLLLDEDFLSAFNDSDSDFETDLEVEGEKNESYVSIEEDSCEEEIRLNAYIPCAAHNIQLVLEDALNLSDQYTQLISKISKNIVSKSQYSSIIAEEMRTFGKYKNL